MVSQKLNLIFWPPVRDFLIRALSLLLLVICQTRVAYAEVSVYTMTSELMEWCKPYFVSIYQYENLYAVAPDNLCTGFITGVTDAHQRFVYNGSMPPYWCGPGGVSKDKLARIVTVYLQANSENLNVDAASAVMSAVKEAYPCK